jgi:hypothetical protein
MKRGDNFQEWSDLEHKLAERLKPVRPDPQYVNRLWTSLGTSPEASLERRSVADEALMIILGLTVAVTTAFLIHKLTR